MSLESVNGRQTFFGALPDKQKRGAIEAGMGAEKQIEWKFSYDDLPADDENARHKSRGASLSRITSGVGR